MTELGVTDFRKEENFFAFKAVMCSLCILHVWNNQYLLFVLATFLNAGRWHCFTGLKRHLLNLPFFLPMSKDIVIWGCSSFVDSNNKNNMPHTPSLSSQGASIIPKES